jgi:hypothetical protein
MPSRTIEALYRRGPHDPNTPDILDDFAIPEVPTMIAQLRWVGSSAATAPIELFRLINRIAQGSRYASCWLLTQHTGATRQVDRSGRLYLACPDCGHQSRGWQTPWRGSRQVI